MSRTVALLESRRLDIDVEILESTAIKLGRLYDIETLSQTARLPHHVSLLRLHLSPALGAAIVPLDDHKRSGTAGIWLVCGPPEARERFLLTCSHVIHTHTAKSTTPNTSSSLACDPAPIAQFLGKPFSESHKFCLGLVEHELERFHQNQERVRDDPLHDASRAESKKQTLDEAARTVHRVSQDFANSSQHIIGLSHALSDQHLVRFGGATWTCDWALIRPDPNAFEGSTVNEFPITRSVFRAFYAKKADLDGKEAANLRIYRRSGTTVSFSPQNSSASRKRERRHEH